MSFVRCEETRPSPASFLSARIRQGGRVAGCPASAEAPGRSKTVRCSLITRSTESHFQPLTRPLPRTQTGRQGESTARERRVAMAISEPTWMGGLSFIAPLGEHAPLGANAAAHIHDPPRPHPLFMQKGKFVTRRAVAGSLFPGPGRSDDEMIWKRDRILHEGGG